MISIGKLYRIEGSIKIFDGTQMQDGAYIYSRVEHEGYVSYKQLRILNNEVVMVCGRLSDISPDRDIWNDRFNDDYYKVLNGDQIYYIDSMYLFPIEETD